MTINPFVYDEKLIIEYSNGSDNLLWEKPLDELKTNLKQNTNICIDKEERHKIFIKIRENDWMLVVYSDNKYVYCASGSPSYVYNTLLRIKSEVVKLGYSRKRFWMLWHGHYSNPLNLDIKNTAFILDEQNQKPFDIPIYRGKGKRQFIKNLRLIKFNLDDILYKDVEFLHNITTSMEVDEVRTTKPIYLFHGQEKDTRYYYVPVKSTFYKEYATHIRRNEKGRLFLVRRPKYDFEYNIGFKFFNSKLVSNILYLLGKGIKKISSKRVGLFYEKFCEKAEEGTFEVFQKLRDESSLIAYFVVDKKTQDYQRIKDQKNIVTKYSAKHFWLLYRANMYVSTEVPAHLLSLRSNNIVFRKSCLENTFIFLQHGIVYMKRLGKSSAFCRGKDSFPTYMVVGSEKEKNVVSELLEIDNDKLLKCGVPIYSVIDYMHINQGSENKAVVMLTWKPYEEYITEYEETEYYKKTVQIASLLEKYLQHDDIIIVAHPKVQHLLANTHLKDRIWLGPVSEALKAGKLLITDYSSVCYNTFYQGGGVIFYHEDVDYYESYVGKLIPLDNEYIGHRVFSLKELEKLLDESIRDGKIDLQLLRTEQYVHNYNLINEFSDGKNVDRICDEIMRLEL